MGFVNVCYVIKHSVESKDKTSSWAYELLPLFLTLVQDGGAWSALHWDYFTKFHYLFSLNLWVSFLFHRFL